MIDKLYGGYIVTCDSCGEGFEAATWSEVMGVMRDDGWRKKLVNGTWELYCPDCVEAEREE